MNERGGRKIVHNKIRIHTAAAAWTFCLVVVPYVDMNCVLLTFPNGCNYEKRTKKSKEMASPSAR